MKLTAPEVARVLDAISDEVSLSIFELIKKSTKDTETIKLELKLSRKQCYDRIQNLMGNGLIKRKNRCYSLTSFGQVVYDAQAMVDKAIENRSALEMVDALRHSDIPQSERTKFVNSIIPDLQLREIITKQVANNS